MFGFCLFVIIMATLSCIIGVIGFGGNNSYTFGIAIGGFIITSIAGACLAVSVLAG